MATRADIRLWVDDGTGTFYPVLNLRDATYRQALGYVPVASPDSYGAEHGEPGLLSFEIECDYVRAVSGAAMEPGEQQQRLLSLLRNRSAVEVALEFPGGEWRRGTVYVSNVQGGASIGQPVPQSVSFQGTAAPGTTAPPTGGGGGSPGGGGGDGGGGGGSTAAASLVVATQFTSDLLVVYELSDGTERFRVSDTQYSNAGGVGNNASYVHSDHSTRLVYFYDGNGFVEYDPVANTFRFITWSNPSGGNHFTTDSAGDSLYYLDAFNDDVERLPLSGGSSAVEFGVTGFGDLYGVVYVPTGPYIVVVGNQFDHEGSYIVRYNPDGTGETVLYDRAHPGYLNDAVYDPDSGDVFVATDDPTDGILRVDPTGAVAPYSIGKGGYEIAVDGDWVYYGSSIVGESGIWRMRKDGTNAAQFLNVGYNTFDVGA